MRASKEGERLERSRDALLRRVWADDRGVSVAALRALLAVPAGLYGGVTSLRNALYDRRILSSTRVDTPIVCVGNLTVGGTGKTPMVSWIARHFLEDSRRVTILSRGYGADETGRNDEARMLHDELPDVPHVLDADRVAGAREAGRAGAEVIVLDDGFQHRRLARDLDIVLLDASLSKHAYRSLPLGAMRESFAGLRRASIVVLTRVDQANPEAIARLRSRVSKAAPDLPIAEAVHGAVGIRRWRGDGNADEDVMSGRRFHLFSAIGNPAGFERAANEFGVRASGVSRFADHHRYVPDDFAEISRAARAEGADALLTTHKDAVKIPERTGLDLPVFVLHVAMRFRSGESVVRARLDGLVSRR